MLLAVMAQNSSFGNKLPARVQVAEVVCSRYGESVDGRPACWAARKGGVDVIKTTSGETVRLLSEGQQSTPEPGWILMLRDYVSDIGVSDIGVSDACVSDACASEGYRWTLFGIPQA